MSLTRFSRQLLRANTINPRRLSPASRAHFSTTSQRHKQLTQPLNLPKWLSQNSHLLKPPINNYCISTDPQTIMVVGGPNARTDYHINSTPEYFFQYKGSMLLKTVDMGQSSSSPSPSSSQDIRPDAKPVFKDIPIHEGCMYLLPAGVPHNPVRFADTVGVVIEQPRAEGEVDRLRWYCQSCGEKVEEKSFVCEDLGSQIKEAVLAFERDEEARTCRSCGAVCEVRPRDVEALRPVPDD